MSVDDAIVFFPFSEASGGATPDAAGGRTGLLKGGAGIAEAGRVGAGLALPGAGAFVELADEPGFDLAGGTLAFWVRPDAIGAAQGLVSRDSVGFGAGEMSVLLRADGRVSFRLETAGKTFFAQSQRALDAGDWAHVAVSWGEGGMRLHLDGVLDGATSHAGGIAGNAQPWVIGASAIASGAGTSIGVRDHFTGTIDEVALFDRPLGAAELGALIAGGGGGDGGGNAVPMVAAGVPDRSATVGEAFDFAPPADAFADPDGDALSLTASAADGGALPDWLGFDGARFAGVPPAGAAGTLALRVTASDGEAAVADDFVLTIATAPPAADKLSFAGQTGRAKEVDLARGFWADAPRVMALGDSNTLGLSNALPTTQLESYRAALWSRLTEDRFWIDYVGSRTNGPAGLPDRSHQGVSGIRATQVVGQADDLAAAHRPDVVLMMLGTNDALNEADAASTVPAELLSIMRSFDEVRPGVTVLIAPLPPIDADAPGYTKRADAEAIRAALNARLPDLAQDARDEGIDARFVPMPALGEGDLYDGVHLTRAGHAKLAAAWSAALEDGLAGGDFGGPRSSTVGGRDVTGSEAGDFLRGDGGVNTLVGRGGADRIEGGPGADVLTGGAAADVFAFATPVDGGDRITDFAAADFLEVSAAGFGGGLQPGGSVILRSAATPLVQGGAGQFLYDRDDGRLRWDPDGTGSAPAVLIATLAGAPALGAGDFLVL